MARARRGARPCGAWRSAGLTDRWTGSDRLREAEGTGTRLTRETGSVPSRSSSSSGRDRPGHSPGCLAFACLGSRCGALVPAAVGAFCRDSSLPRLVELPAVCSLIAHPGLLQRGCPPEDSCQTHCLLSALAAQSLTPGHHVWDPRILTAHPALASLWLLSPPFSHTSSLVPMH